MGTAIIFFKIAVRSAIRSTLLTTGRLVAASEGRTSCIACKAIHEQEEWATGAPVCRSFSFFFQKRTRLKDYKKNVRKQINGKFYSRMRFQVNTPRLCRWTKPCRLPHVVIIVGATSVRTLSGSNFFVCIYANIPYLWYFCMYFLKCVGHLPCIFQD